jgi:hypothetical protein
VLGRLTDAAQKQAAGGGSEAMDLDHHTLVGFAKSWGCSTSSRWRSAC